MYNGPPDGQPDWPPRSQDVLPSYSLDMKTLKLLSYPSIYAPLPVVRSFDLVSESSCIQNELRVSWVSLHRKKAVWDLIMMLPEGLAVKFPGPGTHQRNGSYPRPPDRCG